MAPKIGLTYSNFLPQCAYRFSKLIVNVVVKYPPTQ